MRTAILMLFFSICAALPVRSQFSVLSQLTDEATLTPGEASSGIIRVQSTSDAEIRLLVYQKDYFTTAEEGISELDAGTLDRSNAPWIQVSPSNFTLPPKQVMDVAYRIAVPTDLRGRLSGTYWSRIYIESVPSSAPTGDDAKARFAFSQTARYGLQVITHITGTGSVEIAFKKPTLVEREDGARVLEIDVENTGDLMTKPAVWIEVYDDSGNLAARLDGYAYRLYPGTSTRQRISIDGIAEGRYKLLVVADDGGSRLFGAQYDLTF